MRVLTMENAQNLARELARHISSNPPAASSSHMLTLFGVPRGGIPTMMLVAHELHTMGVFATHLQSSACVADSFPKPWWLVDDIIVTGRTVGAVPGLDQMEGIVTLVAKGLPARGGKNVDGIPIHFATTVEDGTWVHFPWETPNELAGPEDAVRRLIEYAGDDPTRAGVKDTPARVLRFLDEIREDRSFNETGFETSYDDLVVVRNIHFASLCEHHMLPYFGTVAVGYIPDGKIIGLSKIARIVFQESGGLTIQEELSRKIAEHVKESTGSEDVGVVTQATHSCMVVRGPRALGSDTFASSMLGKFRDEQELRAEFYSIVRDLR